MNQTEPIWLIDTTDAAKWAAEFVRMHGGDEGLMLTWFANAIETGRRAGQIADWPCQHGLSRMPSDVCVHQWGLDEMHYVKVLNQDNPLQLAARQCSRCWGYEINRRGNPDPSRSA